MNNNSNNCGDCGTTCSECGRPWAICKQDGGCGCNKCKDIKFCEYGRMTNGCIREKQPGCPMQAVIPSVTVESIEGIKNLADCLVHVSDINTTFYIDDKHRPIITWAGPIDIPGYDMEGNPNNYRDQIVTDTANQMAVIYDKSGKGYLFGLAENIDLQEQVNNKLDEMAEDGTLAELINYNKTMLLYRGDGSLNNNYTISGIELPVPFSELTDMEITLKSSTNRYVNSGKIYYPTNGMIIPIVAVLGSPTYMYYMMTEILLSNDNKLTFQAQYRMRINRSTGAIDYTDYPSNGKYYFKFINVRGGKDGFNLLVGENE